MQHPESEAALELRRTRAHEATLPRLGPLERSPGAPRPHPAATFDSLVAHGYRPPSLARLDAAGWPPRLVPAAAAGGDETFQPRHALLVQEESGRWAFCMPPVGPEDEPAAPLLRRPGAEAALELRRRVREHEATLPNAPRLDVAQLAGALDRERDAEAHARAAAQARRRAAARRDAANTPPSRR